MTALPGSSPDRPTWRGCRKTSGFTLVEILVSMVILLVIITLGFNALSQTSKVWQRTTAQVSAFQGARLGFDLMTRTLSQATLNTYLEYVDGQVSGPYFASDASYNNQPVRYARKSDLHFVCAYPGTDMATGNPSGDTTRRVPGTYNTGTAVFFQAPVGYTVPVFDPTTGRATSDTYNGLATVLNPVGYYVEYGPDVIPAHVTGAAQVQRSRYRLKQLLVPSDRNSVFALSTRNDLAYDPANPARWFTGTNLTDANGASNARTVADNVLAFIVRIEDPSTPNLTAGKYIYDSHANERTLKPSSADPTVSIQPLTANQIPPVINVTMVAIDEVSALQMNSGTAEPTVLKTLLAAPVNGQQKFTLLSNYAADLAALEKGLVDARVNYRVFATAVPIRESKWTK